MPRIQILLILHAVNSVLVTCHRRKKEGLFLSVLFNDVIQQGQRRFGTRQGLSDLSSRSIMVMWRCENPDERDGSKKPNNFLLYHVFF